jgi:hypothetical protein
METNPHLAEKPCKNLWSKRSAKIKVPFFILQRKIYQIELGPVTVLFLPILSRLLSNIKSIKTQLLLCIEC